MTDCILPDGTRAEILGPVTATTSEGLWISHTEFLVRVGGLKQPVVMSVEDLRGTKFRLSVLRHVRDTFAATLPDVVSAWDRLKAVSGDLE